MPLTLIEVLQRSTEYLSRTKIPNPRFEAELVLAHTLKVDRIGLYLHFDQPLKEEELVPLRELLARRARGWPMAYLLGQREFHGLDFMVEPGVLIPRPETELLVDLALERIQHWPGDILCADLGCGSGCIGVSLAVKAAQLRVVAVDSEPVPLRITALNAQRHQVGERVEVVPGAWAEPIRERGPVFQLLVSNPPYVTTEEWGGLETQVRDHEPRQALDGGPDGLDCYRSLLPQLVEIAAPRAVLLLEGDPRRLPAVSDLCAGLWPLAQVTTHRDLSQRERVLEVCLP